MRLANDEIDDIHKIETTTTDETIDITRFIGSHKVVESVAFRRSDTV
jgi:hypothetical protein